MSKEDKAPAAPEVDMNLGGTPDEDYDDWEPSAEDLGSNFQPGDEPKTDADVEKEEKQDDQTDDQTDDDDTKSDETDDTKTDDDSDDKDDDGESKEADDSDTTTTETKEETDEEGKEPAAKEKQSDQSIPKKRFDKVNERMKAAEARLRELDRQQQSDTTTQEGVYDFDAKEKEHTDLVVDGKLAEANALRAEIRSEERKVYRAEAVEAAKTVTNQSKEQSDFQRATAEIEVDYDVLNPDHDSFSQERVDQVVELMAGFVHSGRHTQADALRKAVDYVAVTEGLEKNTHGEAPAKEAAKEDVKETKPPSKKETRKKVEAQAKTPPRGKEAGESLKSEAGVDINDLSDDEFDALPESKLRELRGDFV